MIRFPMIHSAYSKSFIKPLLLLLALASQNSVNLPFGAWKRVSETPVISPQGNGWESAGTFNPSVILHDGKIVMLYRAQDKSGTSRLGYAESADGTHFTRRSEPVFSPEKDYEKDGGVEDPRLVQFGDTYYLTYTGYNKKDAQLCLATSKDLIHWDRQGVILPAYKGRWNVRWTKSGAIVPEKIAGKYWMYFLGTAADNNDQMGLASSSDLLHWTETTDAPVLPVRAGKFDSRVAEPGPVPIVTSQGIVLIYNGADDKLVYRTGVAVFDRNDPRRVISRTDDPVFSPEKEWEKVGQVPNVVFVEGMLRQENQFLFYYGGADKYIGVAEAPALP
ncbi:MAG: glycoside hydrolase family 130 protein [Candidatus Sulfotelmatobacter sp.]